MSTASSKRNVSDSAVRPYLDKYYEHLFPWDKFYRWFCYQDASRFSKREFAFKLFDTNYFLRRKSFDNDGCLKEFVGQNRPIKIDIGSYYSVHPNIITKHTHYEVTEKELVFDIDLSEYDDVRKCCKDKKVCRFCWKFAAIACKILDATLREDYGWNLILWVFSGSRGIHCWVCDESARKMTDKQRRQFVSVLDLKIRCRQIEKAIPFVSKRLNNHIRRSYAIAKDAFIRVCVEEQDVLGTEERAAIFLALLPEICREEMKKIILNVMPGKERWVKFHEYWNNQKVSKSNVWRERPHLIEEITLWYLYPRIDANVTRRMDHLLKAPFSPHPETEAVCIPFDPREVDEFDVEDVPRLRDFVDAAITMKDSEIVATSLNASSQVVNFRRSMRLFEDFVKQMEEMSIQR